ncbi:unnamed protein product [Rotaria sp. Silwood2]|nr:unnamed protein product [Rotaria sp. Silwood2]CAF4318560.1 unnamed protein product [Rotaria sp. Silwood2]
MTSRNQRNVKHFCHDRLHTKLNYEFIKTVGEHENHIGNPRCEATPTIGVPDEVRIQLPNNHNLKRNIRRWRQENTTEPTPTSIDFPVIPQKYHETTRDNIFFQKDVGQENATEFFIDGTFKVVPQIFFQLFAIHASYRDHVIPVTFILLSSKKEEIYQVMVDEIIQLAPAWQPQRVMMDFEKATINVFNRAFPIVELSGCYFHICQSVPWFLLTHGFKQLYETDVTFADNIHKIIALAFIEPSMVIDGFVLLCSNLDYDYQQLLDYIGDNYIGRLRGRTRRQVSYPIDFWNIVTRVKSDLHRTNNNFEGWHRKLNCAFQCSHPSLWTFLDKLIKEENNIHSDIINAMTGRQPPRVGNDSAANKDKHGFLKDFIDTSTSNLTKSSNYFRCSDTIKNFALLLYILGGKLTYEFIQLNLPGSLSNLTMFNIMISNLNSKFSEEEFQFDQLQKHLDDLNV